MQTITSGYDVEYLAVIFLTPSLSRREQRVTRELTIGWVTPTDFISAQSVVYSVSACTAVP